MILHLACLPFPSYQGTQAAIASMLRASADSGRRAHLLTYAHGAYELDGRYTVHRIADFPKLRSLRSGPSLGKVALDLRCVPETRRLARRLQAKAIVAHHVEAALAALAARVAPVYYVAHTSLQRELPVYFPRLPSAVLAKAAARVERQICARAAGVAAVAPSLSRLLGKDATYLPVPWAASNANRPARAEARAALGLGGDGPVCLYAGNLDPYQGWERLVAALAIVLCTHPGARLLIATESDPTPARLEAARLGVSKSVRLCRLDGERARALAHAASDWTWVPRRTEGGLPIKMLDAFARGLPVVAMRRATAALPVRSACIHVDNDDAEALAAGAKRLIDNHAARLALREAAERYLAAEHSTEAFELALRDLLVDRVARQTGGLTHPRPARVRCRQPLST